MTSGKLKVLFLAADPYDHDTKLETGAEMRAIEHAIQATRESAPRSKAIDEP